MTSLIKLVEGAFIFGCFVYVCSALVTLLFVVVVVDVVVVFCFGAEVAVGQSASRGERSCVAFSLLAGVLLALPILS